MYKGVGKSVDDGWNVADIVGACEASAEGRGVITADSAGVFGNV